jgi:exopolyphosphatase/guanosine-5'-triphosphate,3'-diphosphate pyrophosphatase
VVARCPEGHPLVIRNATRDADGTPFPTRYWLTCPAAVRAVSRLESKGAIGELNLRADEDQAFSKRLGEAHLRYAADRARAEREAFGWGGVGGTATGVKCLHAHLAYLIAGGPDPVGEWTAAHLEPYHPAPPEPPVAAVDLGTNSIRLLVALRNEDGSLRDLARDMVITRIGQGVDATGRLSDESLKRTLRVLERYARRARALGAERIQLSATSAVRDASNREELAGEVERITGSPMRVLTGAEEAAASFLGAVRTIDAVAPFLVMDIGGGSTEFVLGHDTPTASISADMGSVRLTERHVREDPPSAGDLERLRQEADTFLDAVEAAVPVREARTLVAVAGTTTTAAAMSLDLPEYDPDRIHNTRLSFEEARTVLQRLAAMTTLERGALPFMAPGREDVIVAGVSILVRAMERFGFEEAVVSEHDILDGLALGLFEIR